MEFDHADIFPDLRAIQTQFHHLVRTVPGSGGSWNGRRACPSVPAYAAERAGRPAGGPAGG